MFVPEIPLAQRLIDLLQQAGIQRVVISPGSRNAPLTLGLSQHPYFLCYSVVDERSAGFFALGMAQQTQQPVALLCTSGSAVLNYYPAVAEAFYSQIPLVVLSADRPPHKIDIGDGQTIRQDGVLAAHCVHSTTLTPEDTPDNCLRIQAALQAAVTEQGPVHLNIPFEEPLYGEAPQRQLPQFTYTPPAAYRPAPLPLNELSETLARSPKIMVLVGSHPPDAALQAALSAWCESPQVLLLTEVTAHIHHPKAIHSIDTLITHLSAAQQADLSPNVLITFGGMVVSKRIKQLLRQCKPQQHWHIDPLRAYDTYGALTQHYRLKAVDFFTHCAPPSTTSDYAATWQHLFAQRWAQSRQYVQQAPYSDLYVYQHIWQSLSTPHLIQWGNSAAIRYAQLLAPQPQHRQYCNRGTSGIDGSVSTALGAAVVASLPMLLMIGDLSFLYDSNGLWQAYTPANAKIALINNGGGGIFRILPGARNTTEFHTYFETQHQLTAAPLCQMHGWQYFAVHQPEALPQALADWHQASGPALLEVFTPTTHNDQVLKNYFKP